MLRFFSELAEAMKRGWILACWLLLAGVSALAQDGGIVISELMTSNATGAMDTHSEPDDWVELHNRGGKPFQLAGCYFSTSQFGPRYPINGDAKILPGGYGIIFCDPGTMKGPERHCDVPLAFKPGWIGLYGPDSTLLDSLSYPLLRMDQSFGYQEQARWYNRPTPAAPNDTNYALAQVHGPSVRSSEPEGFFSGRHTVTLSAPENSTIYWCTGGHDPLGPRGKPYTEPITIGNSKVLRTTTLTPGKLSPPVQTFNYLKGSPPRIPVVALATPCWSSYYYQPKRALTNRRRPATLSFLDKSQNLEGTFDVAIKLSGGASRLLPQKSISVELRQEAGWDGREFPNALADKQLHGMQKFVLRNFGNGHPKVFFKDVLLQQLLANNDNIDYLGYQTVQVYINGGFAGLYNLREKKSMDYVCANNPHIPRANVDMLELLDGSIDNPKGGAAKGWKELHSFVNTHDLAQPEHFEWVSDRVDLANFTDYQIAQIFYANTDWPQANVKLWRDSRNGKWRWILFDLDQALLPRNTTFNAMAYALGKDPLLDPEALAALQNNTLLLRKLMANASYKQHFATRWADLMNSSFSLDSMLSALQWHTQRMEPLLPAQLKRWGGKGSGRAQYPANREEWQRSIATLEYSIKDRPRDAWEQV